MVKHFEQTTVYMFGIYTTLENYYLNTHFVVKNTLF